MLLNHLVDRIGDPASSWKSEPKKVGVRPSIQRRHTPISFIVTLAFAKQLPASGGFYHPAACQKLSAGSRKPSSAHQAPGLPTFRMAREASDAAMSTVDLNLASSVAGFIF
jgi:hypothetical protein